MVMVCCVLVGCESRLDAVRELNANTRQSNESAEQVSLIYTDSGRLKARLFSPEMLRYHQPKIYLEMPKGLTVVFYDEQGKPESFLKADYGIRYENERRTEVKRNVLVVNSRNDSLKCQSMIWDEATHKIWSADPIKIIQKTQILGGVGFESDETFNQYKILKPYGSFDVKP